MPLLCHCATAIKCGGGRGGASHLVVVPPSSFYISFGLYQEVHLYIVLYQEREKEREHRIVSLIHRSMWWDHHPQSPTTNSHNFLLFSIFSIFIDSFFSFLSPFFILFDALISGSCRSFNPPPLGPITRFILVSIHNGSAHLKPQSHTHTHPLVGAGKRTRKWNRF